ncbi:MAG TPA: sulfite exporter TauE/SafE family protein [Mycobacteriales bacterium]|nr:sulfite exporter TauE/SafE family protein [Mycobacteriales bacterium]
MDWWLALAGLGVGLIVGMTGMGGGALMTPVLVLFFGIPPLAAVSNDLVTSAVMKPVGAAVHMHRGTIHRGLVTWLVIGSVPAAFCGVLITRALGSGDDVQNIVKKALGAALLIAAASMVAKAYLRLRERRSGIVNQDISATDIVVKPLPTLLIGAAGGIIVGMTSVGSGSLIIIALIALYPRLQASSLVGTDLVQAVPLVFSAALGHIIFGDFQFNLTGALILGSIPGVYIGARLSAQMPGGLIRRVLTIVLLASALKTLEVSNTITVIVVGAAIVLGPLAWMGIRSLHHEPAREEVSA